MEFSFTPDQTLLRNAVRDFFARSCPIALVRDAMDGKTDSARRLWRDMAAAGYLGMAVPAKHGGDAQGLMEQVILCQEAGRALAPLPLIDATMVAPRLLLRVGAEEQREAYLPTIAKGELTLGLAVAELGGDDPRRASCRISLSGGACVLDGRKCFVTHAALTGGWLVVARRGARYGVLRVERGDGGVSVESVPDLARTGMAALTFADATLPADRLLGGALVPLSALTPMLREATVLHCADMIGAAERLLELAVDYAKRRQQYGRPIGSFQAVQHKLVNAFLAVESAKHLTYEAAWALGSGDARAADLVAMAKARVDDGCSQAAYEAHATHAGLGFLESCDVHLFSRRLMQGDALFGSSDSHRERVADSLRHARSRR